MAIRWDRTQGSPEPISALNRVHELECGEPLVDMRIEAPSIVILRSAVIPFCRLTVAQMAERAAQSLPAGIRFGLVDAWRPIERQQRIYDFLWRSAKEAYPDRSYASLKRTVNRWAAPTDQPAPPGHCTGAALDLWLIDEQGEPIDVSSPYDRFSAAPTFAIGLSDTAARNRRILHDALVSVGFSNCRDEWWHYSYGDAGYAVRKGATQCIYGLATLDSFDYTRHEREHELYIAGRPNPFLTGR